MERSQRSAASLRVVRTHDQSTAGRMIVASLSQVVWNEQRGRVNIPLSQKRRIVSSRPRDTCSRFITPSRTNSQDLHSERACWLLGRFTVMSTPFGKAWPLLRAVQDRHRPEGRRSRRESLRPLPPISRYCETSAVVS